MDFKHTLVVCVNKAKNDSASSVLARSHTGLVTTFPQLEDDSVSSPIPLKAGLSSPFYYDSCVSVSVTIDFQALKNPTLLHTPELLGGMSIHHVSMTHVGSLPFLPPAIRKCYYSPNGTHNLLSLGYFQKRSYSYHSVGLNAIHVLNPDHTSFEIAHLSENLLPQSALYPSSPPDTVAMVGPHYNQEQRDRCLSVIALRAIHGSCIHCAQASYRKKPMPPSLTPLYILYIYIYIYTYSV